MATAANTSEPVRGEDKGRVEVCLFDESPERFSRAVRAISELATGEPEPSFPEYEVERSASTVTFLREWRHFSYEPRVVSFTSETGSSSSEDGTYEVSLPQFSSVAVPQITQQKDKRDDMDSSDYILFAGGSVWALDWCPRLHDKPCSSINCEYLAVAAHPPGSSYHKLGMPLTGRGIIQIWCLVTPYEDVQPHQKMNSHNYSSRRGRPRKTADDCSEPSLKRPRGRPRKCLPSVAKPEDTSQNSENRDACGIDPLIIPDDLPLAFAMPRIESVDPTPRKCRGRPSKNPVDKVKGSSPAHISSGANCKEETSIRSRGRPRKKPLLIKNSCPTSFGGQVQNSQIAPMPKTCMASVEDAISFENSHGKDMASDFGSICSSNYVPVVSADAVSPVNLSPNANHKVLCGRKGRKPKKKSALTENSCLQTFGDEAQKTERASAPIMSNNNLASAENATPLGSSNSAKSVGLNQSKSKIMDCEVKVNNSNTENYTFGCNIEKAPADQAASVTCEKAALLTDETNSRDLTTFKQELRKDDEKMNTCSANLNFSPIPKETALPRVVLCLAHNGKVAWDVKWKPPFVKQSEENSYLGHLAVLLGNGSLEVWEVPSPSMVQKIYSSFSIEGTDPRFLKLQPVFRCASVKCGNIQSIPLTVDWLPSPPHDMILAGCHDGTVALWKFSTDLPSQDSKPLMCFTADSVPIRALSWAPYESSEENPYIFVTAGEDGLKFWNLRDPYHPLWEMATTPKSVLSIDWLKDARGIVFSMEDGTLKFLSLSRNANDVPVTGRPFVGTKTQGVTYQLSEYLIWSVHISQSTGHAAYCVADGTAIHFQLSPRFWEADPGRNRAPYFLCGSLSENGKVLKISSTSQSSPLPNVPLVSKKGSKACQDIVQVHDMHSSKQLNPAGPGDDCNVNPEHTNALEDGHDEGQGTNAVVLYGATDQESAGICNNRDTKSSKEFEIFPRKAVALHRLRWNTNKGSEKWLCNGGAAGIIRCQKIL